MPAGRPTKYKPEYVAQAGKLCLLGATDAQLADFFEVAEDTINEWKNIHPEFSVSLKENKEAADNEVIKSLFQRAKGYSHKAVKIFQRQYPRLKTKPSNIDEELEEDAELEEVAGADNSALIVPYIEHYPPDTTACIFWLKNRQPKEWRDRQEIDATSKGEKIGILYVGTPPKQE